MGTTYTLVKLPDDSSAVTGTLACTMKYTVKDCDPATGVPDDEEGYADEFVVSSFMICAIYSIVIYLFYF
jgi:coatomer protein complex subunit gamma